MTFYITLLFFIIYGRGYFEIFSTKYTGYMASVISLFLLFLLFLNQKKLKPKKIQKTQFSILTIFILAVLGSLLITSILNQSYIYIGIIYSILHMFFLTHLAIQTSFENRFIVDIRIPCLITGIYIGLSAILQLIGYIDFPGGALFGDSLTRLSGSLGSKQHLGFSSAFFCVALWAIYKSDKTKKIYLIISIISAGISLISLTRNGLPMIIIPVVYILFREKSNNIIKYGVLFFFTVFSITLFNVETTKYTTAIKDRIETTFSAISGTGSGNSNRISAWKAGLDEFTNGSYFIGNKTGFFSQAGDRLSIVETKHFESAIIQQFGNYGIIGGISFLMILIFSSFTIKDLLLKPLSWAMILNFFYYPGSESLPIVASWFILLQMDNILNETKRAKDENINS